MVSSLGVTSDEFTCLFAAGRIAGWCSHIVEQAQENRLIHPQVTYLGPDVHPFEPINQRTGISSASKPGPRAANGFFN